MKRLDRTTIDDMISISDGEKIMSFFKKIFGAGVLTVRGTTDSGTEFITIVPYIGEYGKIDQQKLFTKLDKKLSKKFGMKLIDAEVIG